MRDDVVQVRASDGGAVTFCAGTKYVLQLAAGAETGEWGDGSPITRAEFEAVLAPEKIFEIVAEAPAAALRKE